MKANILKRNKVKNFRVSLTCTVLPRSEFELVSRYYKFICTTCTPRKVDMAYNCRSFYKIGCYNYLRYLYSNFTYEKYMSLPNFICVECVKIQYQNNEPQKGRNSSDAERLLELRPFLGMGGRGNSPPEWDGNANFIYQYAPIGATDSRSQG